MAYQSPHCSTPEVATSRSNLMESNEVRHSSNRKPWGLTHNLWIWKLALVLLRGSSREPWLFVSNAGFCTFWTYIVFSIREQFSENFSLARNTPAKTLVKASVHYSYVLGESHLFRSNSSPSNLDALPSLHSAGSTLDLLLFYSLFCSAFTRSFSRFPWQERIQEKVN